MYKKITSIRSIMYKNIIAGAFLVGASSVNAQAQSCNPSYDFDVITTAHATCSGNGAVEITSMSTTGINYEYRLFNPTNKKINRSLY